MALWQTQWRQDLIAIEGTTIGVWAHMTAHRKQLNFSWGLWAYSAAAVVSAYFLIKAMVFRNEINIPLHVYTAGPVFALSIVRLVTLIWNRNRKPGRRQHADACQALSGHGTDVG